MSHEHRIRWFAREILPHEGDVRRWLLRHIRSMSLCDLDEVMQETYARLWAMNLDGIQEARAYLFVAARRVAGEMVRRSRIVPIETVADIDALGVADETSPIEQRLSRREEVQKLRSVVAALPPKCRQAFVLKKFEGLSQREIADHMGIAESTVEKHLAKALRMVMREMRNPPVAPARSSSSDENRRQRL